MRDIYKVLNWGHRNCVMGSVFKKEHKSEMLLCCDHKINKIKIPLKAGFLLCFILAFALALPPYICAPSRVDAEPGIMRWDTVSTPGSVYGRFDILSPGGDIIDLAAGSMGRLVAVVRVAETPGGQSQLFFSNNWGIEWKDSAYYTLSSGGFGSNEIFHVAVAPDNPNVWAIVTGVAPDNLPKHVYYTDDAGVSWLDTELILENTAETIRSIDISPLYGNGYRDIAVTTVTGTGHGRYYISSSRSWSRWFNQSLSPSVLPVPTGKADYFDIKFSPTYATDLSVALLYATDNATYFNVGFRDTSQNAALSYAFNEPGVEVRNTASPGLASPGFAELNATCMQLPSDFTGQTATLRRAYISLDADPKTAGSVEDGVYRIDDTHVYVLMDTTKTPDKSIYSIAYWGTYAQGKLLLGERMGYPCTATVPTWFTDSPTTCPIPCWYPALKPPTGAANQGTCASGVKSGVGAARVLWSDDGALSYAGTGALAEVTRSDWYEPLLRAPVDNDESAFALSRNNGETWNELGLIDTTIDWLNDVAPTVDCSTIFLASANHNTVASCRNFDSVWRTTLNSDIANPLPISNHPVYYWERIMTRTTSSSCSVIQSDKPLLRLPPGCTDKPDGEVVAWAAQDTTAQMWSGDYGDFWVEITARDPVQDFAFESSTILYDLSAEGMVTRLTYSGTTWSVADKSRDSRVGRAHTIAVLSKDKILVGAAEDGDYAASFSPTRGEQWIEIPRGARLNGNIHVIFDVDFANNKFVYLADDKLNASGGKDNNLTGTVFREEAPAYIKMEDADMMSEGNSAHAAVGWPPTAPNGSSIWDPPHPEGQFGVVMARTGVPQPAVYSAHNTIGTTQGTINSAVCRTLKPWQAMPKYGVPWDCLDVYTPATQGGVHFTLEPSSLKICGCCTMDTYTTLYAIDDVSGGTYGDTGYDPEANQGMLWAYIDCMAKKGPAHIAPLDGGFIGCDPVTGRNQQVDISWEQLCLANKYELEIYKDRNLTMKVNPAVTNPNGKVVITAVTGSITVNLDNQNVTSPTLYISPGALPEAGASYWWRVRVIESTTGQLATSPWSKETSFSIKPGFITKTPVQGIELLSPNNSCSGCPIQPTSFSWTPYKEANKYELVIARDPSFLQVIKRAITTGTAYEYKDALEYSRSYYWRVRGIEISGKSNVSEWSSAFTFQTVDAPPPEPAKLTESQQFQKANPGYIWVVIAIVVAVIILVLVLIRQSRKKSRWD